MDKQQRYDELYLDIAKRIGEMSHDTEHKVGAVIVKDNNILAFGFNGMPSGMPNECTLPEVIHAEANAICKLARSVGNAEGATLYCTLSPCMECAKLIMQSGIARIIFSETYKDEAGILLLHNNNKEVKGVKWRSSLGT